MGTKYNQTDLEERYQLRGMIEQEFSITKIACHLGRDRRTIQRELAGNSTMNGAHKPDTASRFSWAATWFAVPALQRTAGDGDVFPYDGLATTTN